MPLFMDFHKDMHGVTLEDLKMAHKADEEVQGKYNVTYCQFWVNEIAGNVFCLIEAPDLESCIHVHREAHPDYMACAIIEVDQEFVDMTMGKDLRHVGGVVQQEDGSIDLGYRTILMIDLIQKNVAVKNLNTLREAKSFIREFTTKKGGKLLEVAADDVITSIFIEAAQALQCAQDIQQVLNTKLKEEKQEWNVEFKIGIASGQPLTENSDYFEDTLQRSRIMVSTSESGSINISSLAAKLSNADELISNNLNDIVVFKESNENFLLKLYLAIHANLAQENFNVESLCSDLGISRPQLYRKITSLTGKSPNELIRSIRMQQALTMLVKQDSNIAEIALRVGISNPSYFSKCFQDKYGVAPSKFYI